MLKHNEETIKIGVHVIHTVPPSCLNRDDSGSPKSADFGGHDRAYYSSQSINKMVRDSMKKEIGWDSKRTKKINEGIYPELEKLGMEPQKAKKAAVRFETIFMSSKSKSSKSKNDDEQEDKEIENKTLKYYSMDEFKAMAKWIHDNHDELMGEKSKNLQLSKINEFICPNLEISLFGRMDASYPKFNVDGALNKAMAISTHTVNNQSDYFTACDDFSNKEETGAGHIDTIDYNSQTMYKCSFVDVTQLKKNAGSAFTNEQIAKIVSVYVRTYFDALPQGRKNGMFAETMPDFVIIELCRNTLGKTLCNAFSKPISIYMDKDKSIAEISSDKMEAYYNNMVSCYKNKHVKLICGKPGIELSTEKIENVVYEAVLKALVELK